MTKPDGLLQGAIWELVNKHESHDKLAKKIGVTRATVINWEHNTVPSGRNREKLIELGVPAELWAKAEREPETAEMMREALTNQRRQGQDLAKLSKAVVSLSEDVRRALQMLEELRGQEPPQQAQRPRGN